MEKINWEKIKDWVKFELFGLPKKSRVTFFAGGRKIVFYKRKKHWR